MKGLRTHRVNIGDSLQKIARLYGVEEWQEIAVLNHLTFPYVNTQLGEEAQEGVARLGDTLLIPSKSSQRYPEKRNEEIEALAYGVDLDLYTGMVGQTDTKGHLDLEGGDILLAQGLKNLAQQLTTRLSTKKGNLLKHPDFGSELYKYDGLLESQEVDNKVLFEIEHCIRSDSRVKEILDLSIEREGDRRVFKARIVPIEPGQPFNYRYYIDREV